MFGISQETKERLEKEYPIGCRVALDHMDDAKAPPIGSEGTVQHIDDIGTIHVAWDCGSSLGVLYGEDRCHRID